MSETVYPAYFPRLSPYINNDEEVWKAKCEARDGETYSALGNTPKLALCNLIAKLAAEVV